MLKKALIVGGAVLLLAGCGSEHAASPAALPSPSRVSPQPLPRQSTSLPASPSQSPSQSPSPSPADWSDCPGYNAGCSLSLFENEFAQVAPGHGNPHAARYAGNAHPMVFMGDAPASGAPHTSADQRIVDQYPQVPAELTPAFVTDVQLVAIFAQHTINTSCGTYTAQDSGKTGTLSSVAVSVTVTVVAAATGRVVGTRTFTAQGQSCPANAEVSGDPPWTLNAPPAPAYGQEGQGDDGAYSSALTTWVNRFLTGPAV